MIAVSWRIVMLVILVALRSYIGFKFFSNYNVLPKRKPFLQQHHIQRTHQPGQMLLPHWAHFLIHTEDWEARPCGQELEPGDTQPPNSDHVHHQYSFQTDLWRRPAVGCFGKRRTNYAVSGRVAAILYQRFILSLT